MRSAADRRFADRRDRVFLGSTPSARIYRALGVNARVGEPSGSDGDVFRGRDGAAAVLAEPGVPPGPMLLFAGRAQADKELDRLLRVALRARLLFPELQVVIASHVIDEMYIDAVRRELRPSSGVPLVLKPDRDQLANLYSAARVLVTAAFSHFEIFGRASAEASDGKVPRCRSRARRLSSLGVQADCGSTLHSASLPVDITHGPISIEVLLDSPPRERRCDP